MKTVEISRELGEEYFAERIARRNFPTRLNKGSRYYAVVPLDFTGSTNRLESMLPQKCEICDSDLMFFASQIVYIAIQNKNSKVYFHEHFSGEGFESWEIENRIDIEENTYYVLEGEDITTEKVADLSSALHDVGFFIGFVAIPTNDENKNVFKTVAVFTECFDGDCEIIAIV